jgi:hypothetical protein
MKLNKLSVLLKSTFLFLAVTLAGCSDDDDNTSSLNYASFAGRSVVLEIPAGESANKEIKVYSTSTSSSDRVYTINVIPTTVNTDPQTTAEEGSYRVPTTVTIPAGSTVGTFSIQVDNRNLGDGKDIVLGLRSEPGQIVGENIRINVAQFCEGTKVKLDFIFDQYPEETSWEIYDSSFNVVYRGGRTDAGHIGYPEQESFSKTMCLESGSYTLIVYDEPYADGMVSATSVGSYTLSELDADGNETVLGTGGEFGEFDTVEFTID